MSLLQGTVIDLSSDGLGVVRSPSGEITFVPGVWLDEEITFEVISTGKFRMGKVLSWIKKSSAHREAPCKHFGLEDGKCGACAWMGIHYKEQLLAKEKRLSFILKRAHIEFAERIPIFASSEFHYRNRIKLSAKGQELGFIAPRSHNVAPIESCLVAEEWINEEIAKLKKTPLQEREYWIQNGEEASFAQGNSALNTVMKEQLQQLLQKTDFALELFCGEGNFSEVLLSKTKTLKAYESNPTAVDKLQQRLTTVQAQSKDLYAKNAVAELSRECRDTELLFLDPPRSGFKDLAALAKSLKNLKTIIYLSCDPMTFARDVAALEGWERKRLFSFDLFPQTPHIEVMGYLERSGA